MNHFLLLATAYLLGSIPFGFLLVKLTSGRDVRSVGSGNIGATNVMRTAGSTLAILTLVLDIGKGALAVWLADHFTLGSPAWMSAAALAVMAGHAFSPFLRFRGGKAVASFVGAFLYLTPLPLLGVAIVFVAVVAQTRFISLGSIVGAALFPFAVYLIEHPPAVTMGAALVSSAFIIWRHKANLNRLLSGTENVFRFEGRR